MNYTFDTLSEAQNAGFRNVRTGSTVRDTSGPNEYGYAYTDTATGEEAVAVWLRQGRNKSGGTGCVVMMFPPR